MKFNRPIEIISVPFAVSVSACGIFCGQRGAPKLGSLRILRYLAANVRGASIRTPCNRCLEPGRDQIPREFQFRSTSLLPILGSACIVDDGIRWYSASIIAVCTAYAPKAIASEPCMLRIEKCISEMLNARPFFSYNIPVIHCLKNKMRILSTQSWILSIITIYDYHQWRKFP